MADYVLGRFKTDELPLMRDEVGNAVKAAELMMNDSVEAAMNRFNGSK